jgi:hypothetical protein
VYNSTLSAICNANISGQAFGARSSTEQYHPLRLRHASTKSPTVRQPSIVDVVFLARLMRSAANYAFTCRPRPRAAVWESMPFLCSIAR